MLPCSHSESNMYRYRHKGMTKKYCLGCIVEKFPEADVDKMFRKLREQKKEEKVEEPKEELKAEEAKVDKTNEQEEKILRESINNTPYKKLKENKKVI